MDSFLFFFYRRLEISICRTAGPVAHASFISALASPKVQLKSG